MAENVLVKLLVFETHLCLSSSQIHCHVRKNKWEKHSSFKPLSLALPPKEVVIRSDRDCQTFLTSSLLAAMIHIL